MRRSCSGLTFMTGTLHTLWRVRKPCTRACRSGARSVRSPPAPHRGSSRPDRFRGAPGSHDCTCPHASTRVPDCTAPPGHFLDPGGSRRPGSVCVVPAFRRAIGAVCVVPAFRRAIGAVCVVPAFRRAVGAVCVVPAFRRAVGAVCVVPALGGPLGRLCSARLQAAPTFSPSGPVPRIVQRSITPGCRSRFGSRVAGPNLTVQD